MYVICSSGCDGSCSKMTLTSVYTICPVLSCCACAYYRRCSKMTHLTSKYTIRCVPFCCAVHVHAYVHTLQEKERKKAQIERRKEDIMEARARRYCLYCRRYRQVVLFISIFIHLIFHIFYLFLFLFLPAYLFYPASTHCRVHLPFS